MVQADRVKHTSKTEDDITPTLSTRQPMIELAKAPSKLGLLRVSLRDADFGQTVEDAELFFPQTFIENEPREPGREASSGLDNICRLSGTKIRRAHTTFGLSEGGISANQWPRVPDCSSPNLLKGTSTSRNSISIRASRSISCITRYIAGTFPVADHPKRIRPSLHRSDL